MQKIVAAFLKTHQAVVSQYPNLRQRFSPEVFFITSQELADRYPELSPKEREQRITREKGTVFIMQIGGKLKDGQRHDGRAPDYDDWDLNGDLLMWSDPLARSVELSSMGIRVDSESLRAQLQKAGCPARAAFDYHQKILNDTLPLTIGGGIGQSRICLIMLDKAHIGEVQSSIWPEEMIERCAQNNIELL